MASGPVPLGPREEVSKCLENGGTQMPPFILNTYIMGQLFHEKVQM